MVSERNDGLTASSGAAALAVTKLAPQARDSGHVPRRALLEKLDDILARRLTIVHAGAGYGKTSLLTQWLKTLRERGVAAVWLTLEEDEARAETCLEHIIIALGRAGYIKDDSLASLARFNGQVSVNSLATALVNCLAEKAEPLALFLDEYNRARSEETDGLLRLLVRQVPPHVHFIVASRRRPELEIENLRARGELIEIQAQDLRFSDEETAGLLGQSGTTLSSEQLHRLTDRTEGWPIALQMARLWLNGDVRRAGMVADFSGRTTDLARYMTEQVLSELPAEQQDFLMQTAILDRVNGDLANAVTGRHDGGLMLERFFEKSLFVIPESDDWQWFRYHTLFLDFLQARLERHQPHLVTDLHRRAARWFDGHGFLRQAVDHALKAGDDNGAADFLLAAGGWRLILDGRMNVIRAGVSALPEKVVLSRPGLALAKAILMVKDGDIRGGRAFFDSLDNRLFKEAGADLKADREICDHILADYADDMVSYAEIQRLEDLRRQVPANDHVVQAILCDSLSTLHFRFRELEQSLAACDDAINHYREMGSLYGEVFSRLAQARALVAQARLQDAETLLRGTEADLSARFGDAVELSPHTSIYLAEVLSESGRMEEAAERLDQALNLAEHSDGWLELYTDAYVAAAAVAWAREGIDGALTVVKRARAMGIARGFDRLVQLADCDAVYYLSLAGRGAAAAAYSENLEQYKAEAQRDGKTDRLYPVLTCSLALILIGNGTPSEGLGLVEPLIEKAAGLGEVRQFVMLSLVAAHGRAVAGDMAAAARLVMEAVHHGVFTGMRRIYVEMGPLLRPVIEMILKADDDIIAPDRYRDNFLRELLRDLRRAERHGTGNSLGLTPGELEVLRELDHGFSNKEIARRIEVSPNTVKYRLKGLFAKLGVTTRTDAVKRSRELDLLAADDR